MDATTDLSPAPRTASVDDELVTLSHVLRARAESLRDQAAQIPEPVAEAYRRRASELELEAWIAEVQSGIPVDEVAPAA